MSSMLGLVDTLAGFSTSLLTGNVAGATGLEIVFTTGTGFGDSGSIFTRGETSTWLVGVGSQTVKISAPTKKPTKPIPNEIRLRFTILTEVLDLTSRLFVAW